MKWSPHPVAIRKCFLREASSLQHQFHRAMITPHDVCEYVCFTHLGQFSNKMSNIGVTRVVFLSNVWSNKIKCQPLHQQIPLASQKNSVPSGTFLSMAIRYQSIEVAMRAKVIKHFTTDIKQLFQRHPKVSPHLMGFPNGWEEESLWT